LSSLDPISIKAVDLDTIDWVSVLMLKTVAYMDGWVDLPSSVNRMAKKGMVAQAELSVGLLVVDNSGLVGCVFLNLHPAPMYLGKLAVNSPRQDEGISRCLFEVSVQVAKAQGYAEIELLARIKFSENYAIFTAMEFRETGRTAYDGYDWSTSLTKKCRL
jgi:N-acetylglutamate synthase-like GNAT family acetyltransferase